MNGLQVISGVSCYEKDGTAYLRLEDVARGLGFTTVATSGNEVIRWNTVHKYLHDLGVAGSCNGTRFRNSCPTYIPENIFYRLAMKAKNETAEKFQALVADEIIPSIRRTGGYIAGHESMTDAEIMAKALLVAQRTIEQNRAKIEEMTPKAVFADAVSASNTSILVGEMAKLLRQNGVDMGEKRFFQWLRDHGYLVRRNGTDRNMPTQRSMEMGLFTIKETTVCHSDGHTTISKTPKITGAGQLHFINKFLKGDA